MIRNVIEKSKSDAPLNSELEQLLSEHRAIIKVMGVGGGGGNTISRMKEIGIEGAELIAVNTDAQDLIKINADKKLLIGRDITGGLGAGADPSIGEAAAKENEQDIKERLLGADLVFVTCGLGGGTGTGAAPVVAEVAKKLGALTVAVVTLPFEMEGETRWANARYGLEKLESIVDTIIAIPNDKLLQIVPDVPLNTAFKIADEILVNAVKGVTELITKPGLINLDFADVRAVMKSGGVALIGLGESDSESRAAEAVQKAINNPLLDVEVAGASGALVNVIGGPELTLEEARQVVSTITDRLDPDARVIWGAQVEESLKNSLRVMLIVTGVSSAQISGRGKYTHEKRKEKLKNELGIEFIGEGGSAFGKDKNILEELPESI